MYNLDQCRALELEIIAYKAMLTTGLARFRQFSKFFDVTNSERVYGSYLCKHFTCGTCPAGCQISGSPLNRLMGVVAGEPAYKLLVELHIARLESALLAQTSIRVNENYNKYFDTRG